MRIYIYMNMYIDILILNVSACMYLELFYTCSRSIIHCLRIHPYQSHAKNLKSSFMTRNAKVQAALWKSISGSMTQIGFLTKSSVFVKINSAWFRFKCWTPLHPGSNEYMHRCINPCKHGCIRISMHPYIHAYLSLYASNVSTLDTFAAGSTGELERLDLLGGRGIQSQQDLKSYGNNAWRPESQWWMCVFLKNVPLWSTDSPGWFKFISLFLV